MCLLYPEYKWIEAVHSYGCFVGGILYVVMTNSCIAAPVIDEKVQSPRVSGTGVSGEAVLAKAIITPPEDQVERSRKECLAVSMYEEPAKAGQSGLPVVQVAFSFTFSQEYPVMLCGILPLNTA